jgi:hypothetical protein
MLDFFNNIIVANKNKIRERKEKRGWLARAGRGLRSDRADLANEQRRDKRDPRNDFDFIKNEIFFFFFFFIVNN